MGKYFSTDDEVYKHFEPFFTHLLKKSPHGSQMKAARMSFRFIITDPKAEIAVDARDKAGSIRVGSGDGDEDVKINLRADILHQLLVGKVVLMPAIMGRQIAARGVMEKQKELGALIGSCTELYKEYLVTVQREDMLE